MDKAELIKLVKRIKKTGNAIHHLSKDDEELYPINSLAATVDCLAFSVAFELEKEVQKEREVNK